MRELPGATNSDRIPSGVVMETLTGFDLLFTKTVNSATSKVSEAKAGRRDEEKTPQALFTNRAGSGQLGLSRHIIPTLPKSLVRYSIKTLDLEAAFFIKYKTVFSEYSLSGGYRFNRYLAHTFA